MLAVIQFAGRSPLSVFRSTYTALAEATGFSEETIRNDGFVAERVESARRRAVLSWSHHREVLGLEPDNQDSSLDKAEEGGLSRNALRGCHGRPHFPSHALHSPAPASTAYRSNSVSTC